MMLLNSAKSTRKSRIKKGKRGCMRKIQDLFGTCAIPRQKKKPRWFKHYPESYY